MSINCTVDDAHSKVVYDRSAPSLRGLKKKDFIFNIITNGHTDIAVFRMVNDGSVLREHQSRPFPSGALKHKGNDVNDVSCTVKLKKNQAINLNDYFGQ